MMKHLTPLELSGLLDGALKGRARERAERHLEACDACRASLAELEAQDRALAPVLAHDPGDAYFETFAARVEDRIRAQESKPVPVVARGGLREWLATPRGLAWAGGVAALVIGVGLVMVTARETRIPDLRRPVETERTNQVSGTEAPQTKAAEPLAPSPGTSADRLGATAPNDKVEARERSKLEAGAPADREVRSQEEAAPSVGGAMKRSAATPSRAVRVQRNERGLETPVRERGESFTRPPSSAPAAPGTLTKPAPQPLESERKAKEVEQKAEAATEGQSRSLRDEDSAARQPLLGVTQGQRMAGQVCGEVRDSKSRPVRGAQVVIADLGLTATTDADGRFCVDAPIGEHTLAVMAVGFEPLRRSVSVKGQTEANLTLQAVTVLEMSQAQKRALGADDGGKAPAFAFRGDEFAGWPASAREPARKAQALANRAAGLKSAALFDEAAEAWSRTLVQTKNTRAELEARSRLADARYRGWEIAPTASRKTAAIEALLSYLVRAPAGPARDLAARRLDRIRK